MADNSTTYGPAQSRRTRTPIEFTSSEENAGRYTPPSDFQQFLSKIPLLGQLINSAGTIKVNPANTSDINRVVKHESVHALLNPLFQSGQLEQLNNQNPAYSPIAAKIMSSGVGDPNAEAPAYSTTGESGMIGVTNPLSSQYIDNLKQQLFKLDPKLAQKLGAMQQ